MEEGRKSRERVRCCEDVFRGGKNSYMYIFQMDSGHPPASAQKVHVFFSRVISFINPTFALFCTTLYGASNF